MAANDLKMKRQKKKRVHSNSPPNKGTSKLKASAKELKTLYIDKKLTCREIGKMYNVNHQVVRYRLAYYNIPRRNRSQRTKIQMRKLKKENKEGWDKHFKKLMKNRDRAYKLEKEVRKDLEDEFDEVFHHSICDFICFRDGDVYFIEVKGGTSRLTLSQREFKKICSKKGYKYKIIRKDIY